MKNVLIVIGKLVVGGAEKIGRNIGLYADKNKYRIHYVVFGEIRGEYEKELKEVGCKIYHIAEPSQGYIRFCRTISYIIKSKKIDVVHSHTMFNSGLVMMIAKWNHVPIRITHSHTIRGLKKRTALRNIYERLMRKIIIHDSTRLVACGKSAGKWLYGKRIFNKKGILIYNGIELEQFGYSDRKRELIRNDLGMKDTFIIGHVGHLDRVKNQSYILKIMPEILNRVPNTVFMMIGEGNDRKLLEETAKKMGLEEHVVFTGNINNVSDYLSAMDVLAFPSLHEGMPLSLIEAQTNGLPCIISKEVPDDVYLTDLIKPIGLEGQETKWVKQLIEARRKRPENYIKIMYDLGFDSSKMLKRIYQLYDGE